MPNRIEREIEEILTRLDEFVPEERRGRRARRRPGGGGAGGGMGRFFGGVRDRLQHLGITGGHIVLAAVVILMASYFLRGLAPTFFFWATWASLGVIFGAIILSLRPARRSKTPYWRGQPVELHRPNPLMRLRMWWRRRRW